ncbi:MAG TPA: adenylate/guanylate cyclase domain-containing protein [Methylomirabilota bacterium]|jgi:class 3 adenylate cyclase
MTRYSRREQSVYWLLIVLTVVMMAMVTRDAWNRIGRPSPGFAVLENMLVGVGGVDRVGLQPFDVVRAVNGRLVSSTRELQAEIERHPAGTPMRYLLVRNGQLVEEDIPSRVTTLRQLKRFVIENLLPGMIGVALAALVITLQPGSASARLFLVFSLQWAVINVGYYDLLGAHRFTRLFFLAWTFSPAVFVHLALTFPQRQRLAQRRPWVVWVPYAVSAVLYLWLQGSLAQAWVATAGIIATYWTAALVALVVALGITAQRGSTALLRQRAKVLMAGFGLGYLAPVAGTTVEVALRTEVPFLNESWRLGFLFPLAVAYAIVRYQLFDIRAVIRLGTIYSVVTALVGVGYAGLLTGLNVLFARLDMHISPMVAPALVALAVVLLVNPLYLRTQAVLDRMFFRARLDAQRALERLAEAMTTTLDLDRLAPLIASTVDAVFHPERVRLLLADESRRTFRTAAPADGVAVADGGPLLRCLRTLPEPLTRERLLDDPALVEARAGCLGEMDALGADVVVPISFRQQITALLGLGPRRGGAPYTSEDVRLLRTLASQSALALEHARAYGALQAALRRVDILESIRAGLSKFVPRTVQRLIEQAPDAPELAKREVDVSVLFVDIAGYTRLAERLDAGTVNRLVERYFGAFLDEILRNGGDVNETAGDGLMVIFQHGDPRRHAQAAVTTALAIMRRAAEINVTAPHDEPIVVHLAVNSGRAAVGATKIEGTAGTRWTYTASGPVTNIAARLAALADGDGVLVGAATAERLPPELALEDLGELNLRNVEAPVRAFRLAAEDAVPAARIG